MRWDRRDDLPCPQVFEDTEKNGLAVVLKRKGKALRGKSQVRAMSSSNRCGCGS